MTYWFLFALISLGSWIITHDSKSLSKFTWKLAALSIVLLIGFRFVSTFNVTYALLLLTKDVFLLGLFSFLLSILSKNAFLQIGVLTAGSIYLFNLIPDDIDVHNTYNLDKDWEILVELSESEMSDDLQDLISFYDLSTDRFEVSDKAATDLDDYIILGIPVKNESKTQSIYNQIASMKTVKWIEYNEKLYRHLPKPGNAFTGAKLNNTNDPLSLNQWNLQALDMDAYYNYFKQNNIQPVRKAKLFILDSGIDEDHEDLKDVLKTPSSKHTSDIRGHGTHCAGIAAGHTNNKKGIASISPGEEWVELHSVKVMSDLGFGTQKSIIAGILKAVDQGADVINMSLGGRAYQQRESAYQEAIDYAVSKGVIVVAAAGNSTDDASKYVPAKINELITVTAIDNKLNLASFSNYLGSVPYGIAAPGVDILSTFTEGTYEPKSGTSMAAPHVAGLAAIMKALNPNLDFVEAHRIMEITGIPSDNVTKSGKIIQPLEAVKNIVQSPN